MKKQVIDNISIDEKLQYFKGTRFLCNFDHKWRKLPRINDREKTASNKLCAIDKDLG